MTLRARTFRKGLRHAAGAALALAAAFVTGAALAGDDPLHLVVPGTTSRTPASTAIIEERLQEAAVTYRPYAPVPRFALFDLALPADAGEYRALGGHAVMLITVLTQDRSELPLRSVYVRSKGGTVELRPLTFVVSEVGRGARDVRSTFGAHRVDGLYLIPARLYFSPGELVVDFAANRTGFVLSKFSSAGLDDVRDLPIRTSAPARPRQDALSRLIEREFPGFIAR